MTLHVEIGMDMTERVGDWGVYLTERGGGLDRTRICDLLRVKQAL